MPMRDELFLQFRERWTLQALSAMTLPEYSSFRSRDSFTYDVEHKTDALGSIKGNPAFKFGVYARDPGKVRNDNKGFRYDSAYGWHAKHGATADEAFARVRANILTLFHAVGQGDLATVHGVDLSHMFKWKLAFLFQPDLTHPIVMNIFSEEALAFLAGDEGPIPTLQERILASKPPESDFFTFYDEQWARFQNRDIKVKAVEAGGSENRLGNLNTIFYGPPGTGKTYQVLRFLETLKRPVKPTSLKVLDCNHTIWHLAPGLGGSLWNQLRQGNRLGYQWCAKDLKDLANYPLDKPHASIIRRFSQVQKGDYFAVISGVKLLALAQAEESYAPALADHPGFAFQTLPVKWIQKFEVPILLNTTQTMTFCRMNDGNRWDSFRQGLEERDFRFRLGPAAPALAPAEKRSHLLVTFHQSYSYEDFIQGIKPVMDEESGEDEPLGSISYRIEPGVFYRACDLAAQRAGYPDLKEALRDTKDGRRDRFATAEPFYLVIDEINRGNVANIFGELITLVEADKRLGEENEIIVDLPYSKAPFGVPSNLYLLGTMNTADRSVEALDSALRRRFAFQECSPDPEAIIQPEGFDVDVRRLLTALNVRIEQVLDKDHRIGHAYFTSLESQEDPLEALREIFLTKVIPQLEEYCFGAPEKLYRILGPDFVRKEKAEFGLFEENGQDRGDVWKVQVPMNTDIFVQYYGPPVPAN